MMIRIFREIKAKSAVFYANILIGKNAKSVRLTSQKTSRPCRLFCSCSLCHYNSQGCWQQLYHHSFSSTASYDFFTWKRRTTLTKKSTTSMTFSAGIKQKNFWQGSWLFHNTVRWHFSVLQLCQIRKFLPLEKFSKKSKGFYS